MIILDVTARRLGDDPDRVRAKQSPKEPARRLLRPVKAPGSQRQGCNREVIFVAEA
jgi:hypothetical protein